MSRAAPLMLVLLACGGRSELPVCGDGIVKDDEQCDLGDGNEDRPAILLTQGGATRAVMPVDREQDVISFYGYSSESSHTGFEEPDLAALMLFRDASVADGLSLVLHMGIDEDSSGITIDHGRVDVAIDGVPDGATIAVSDEADEMIFLGDDQVRAGFEFWRNADGGVIDGLPFPGSWSIDVGVVFHVGINRWQYVRSDGTIVVLEPSLLANLRTFDTPAACRLDCTIPRCGDGIVDGGEVCDDGNTLSDDGCAPDCRTLD